MCLEERQKFLVIMEVGDVKYEYLQVKTISTPKVDIWKVIGFIIPY